MPLFLYSLAQFWRRFGSLGSFVSIPIFSGIDFLKLSLGSFELSLIARSCGASPFYAAMPLGLSVSYGLGTPFFEGFGDFRPVIRFLVRFVASIFSERSSSVCAWDCVQRAEA